MSTYDDLNREYVLDSAEPCPFCEGDHITAILETRKSDGNKYLNVSITCYFCEVRKVLKYDFTQDTSVVDILENSVTIWNKHAKVEHITEQMFTKRAEAEYDPDDKSHDCDIPF